MAGEAVSSPPLEFDTVRWLTTEEVVDLHDLLVGIQGLGGFPNPGYLDSALNAPKNALQYSDTACDLYDLAAVYLYHIAKAHAFSDANKRTAYASALVFLSANGIFLFLPEQVEELADATVEAAKDRLDKRQLAAIMRRMKSRRPWRGPRQTPMSVPRVRPPTLRSGRDKPKRKGARPKKKKRFF